MVMNTTPILGLPAPASGTPAADYNDEFATAMTAADLLISQRMTNWKDVREFGGVGDYTTDDTVALQDALDAANADGGGDVYIPPGADSRFGISAPLNMYDNVRIRSIETSTRYHLYSGEPTHNPPPTAARIEMRSDFAGSAMIQAPANWRGGGLSDVTLVGRYDGPANCAGLDLGTTTVENGLFFRNVNIMMMPGDGIRGTLLASRLAHCFIGGNKGWGINVDGSNRWADALVSDTWITGNKLGGLNIDSSASTGYVQFLQTRFERSGWDPGAPTAPIDTDSPGIRLRRCQDMTFFACTTDANSGHGLDIAGLAGGVNVFNIGFGSCFFRRDGFGDMSTNPDLAAVRIDGVSGARPGFINFTNCYALQGRADDGGSQPSYDHPTYGLWFEDTDHCAWIGGRIATATRFYAGGATWQDANWNLSLMVPDSLQFTTPRTGRPTDGLIYGMQVFDTTLGQPIWWDGSAWVDATGTAV